MPSCAPTGEGVALQRVESVAELEMKFALARHVRVVGDEGLLRVRGGGRGEDDGAEQKS